MVSGGPISNLIVDFIGDLIFDSGVRCLVLDSVTASALYTSGQWPDGTPSWSDYDAVLIPFLDEAHWRLAVADLTTATLYYLDPDVDLAWTPRPFVKDWLKATRGGRWQQVMWDAPQQSKGAKDCAIAVMAFMLQVARGDGLPFRGSSSAAAQRVHPSYTPGGLTHMRGRIFVSLLYACLDPPSDPSALSQDLKALYISCQPNVTSTPGGKKQDEDDSRTGASSRQASEAEGVAARVRVRAAEGQHTEAPGKRAATMSGKADNSSSDATSASAPPTATSTTTTELLVSERAQLSLGGADTTSQVPMVQPTSAPATLLLWSSTSEFAMPSQALSLSDVVICFSMGRQVPRSPRLRKAQSQRQLVISTISAPLTDSLREISALVTPARGTVHTSPMTPHNLDCLGTGPVSWHDTSATHGHCQSTTMTRKGCLRLKRRRLPRLSSPPPTPSWPKARTRHRPPFTVSPSSPALEPTGAGECPSLGETGPVLPVRAYPQARAGVG